MSLTGLSALTGLNTVFGPAAPGTRTVYAIGADTDDGLDANAGTWLAVHSMSAGNHAWGHQGEVELIAAWRFEDIIAEQGATVIKAYLRLNVRGSMDDGYAAGNVFGADEDTAPAWADTSPTAARPTTAFTAVARPTANGLLIVNVTNIIQEIFDRAGWESGNAIGLMGFEDESGAARQTLIEDSVADGFFPPTLEITV
jgi:hypothetical protein